MTDLKAKVGLAVHSIPSSEESYLRVAVDDDAILRELLLNKNDLRTCHPLLLLS